MTDVKSELNKNETPVKVSARVDFLWESCFYVKEYNISNDKRKWEIRWE